MPFKIPAVIKYIGIILIVIAILYLVFIYLPFYFLTRSIVSGATYLMQSSGNGSGASPIANAPAATPVVSGASPIANALVATPVVSGTIVALNTVDLAPTMIPARPIARTAMDYNALGLGGTPNNNSNYFQCDNKGEYINGIQIAHDNYVNGVQLSCGTSATATPVSNSPWFGTPRNTIDHTQSLFINLPGKSGTVLDSLAGLGGYGGSSWNRTCATGQKLSAMRVYNDGTNMTGVIPYCSL